MKLLQISALALCLNAPLAYASNDMANLLPAAIGTGIIISSAVTTYGMHCILNALPENRIIPNGANNLEAASPNNIQPSRITRGLAYSTAGFCGATVLWAMALINKSNGCH